MTALMIVLGAFALIGICCWVAYDAGRYSAVDELDEYMEVARMLGAYGAALRFESVATGTPVADLMARDQKRGDASGARIVREQLARDEKSGSFIYRGSRWYEPIADLLARDQKRGLS